MLKGVDVSSTASRRRRRQANGRAAGPCDAEVAISGWARDGPVSIGTIFLSGILTDFSVVGETAMRELPLGSICALCNQRT